MTEMQNLIIDAFNNVIKLEGTNIHSDPRVLESKMMYLIKGFYPEIDFDVSIELLPDRVQTVIYVSNTPYMHLYITYTDVIINSLKL